MACSSSRLRSLVQAAGKWRLIIIAAVAYLHVALVVPFAEQTSEKSIVDGDIAGYRSAERSLKPVLASTQDFAERVSENAGDRAKSLRDDLVNGFSGLSVIVNNLMTLDPEAARGEAGATIIGEGVPQFPPMIPGPLPMENIPNMAAPNVSQMQMPAPQMQMPQMQTAQMAPPDPSQMPSQSLPRTPLRADLPRADAG